MLRGINLNIEPGQLVALVGRSGSGKTTVLRMLVRSFDPIQGQVLLAGRDLRDIGPDELSRLVVIADSSHFCTTQTWQQVCRSDGRGRLAPSWLRSCVAAPRPIWRRRSPTVTLAGWAAAVCTSLVGSAGGWYWPGVLAVGRHDELLNSHPEYRDLAGGMGFDDL